MDDLEQKRRQDFADHQDEVGGVSNGRADRFLTGSSSARNNQSPDQDARDRIFETLLQMLLDDPAYAAAYERVQKLADTVQAKISAAMERASERVTHLEIAIEEMDEDTAKLADGTAVYRDANGNLCTADGRPLSEAEAASVSNPENARSYERRRDAQNALNDARARQDKLYRAQRDLDDARRRLDDKDNPPRTVDDIEDIEGDIETIIDDLERNESAKPIFNVSAKNEDISPALDPAFKIDAVTF